MARDVKPYGKIYKYITETVEKNFGKHTLPWKYENTRTALLKAATDEYNADNTYPIRLQESMTDVVLRWCFDGYPQTEPTDILKIFQVLWAFHKKWLIAGETYTASEIMTQMNKEATDLIEELCGGINTGFEKRKEKVQDLFVVAMEHAIEMAKEEPES